MQPRRPLGTCNLWGRRSIQEVKHCLRLAARRPRNPRPSQLLQGKPPRLRHLRKPHLKPRRRLKSRRRLKPSRRLRLSLRLRPSLELRVNPQVL